MSIGCVEFKNKQFFAEIKDSLVTLDLSNQKIHKISEIKGLDSLKKIQHLKLRKNMISVIECLDIFHNLQKLDLGENNIVEISGLDKLINLKQLTLGINKITGISGLEKLKNLQYLSLRANSISEIKGISDLKKLSIIDLSNNNILDNEKNQTEINQIKNLLHLKDFIYDNNPIFHSKSPLQKDRRNIIELLVNQKGSVVIEQLVERFKVSRMTIHRDLKFLEEHGKIKKVHGGATRLDIKPDPLFEKFLKILNISLEIKIEWVAENLELTRNELLDKLIEWSELTSFKIKGDLIVIMKNL
ncbi:MAG: DeoR family transcriptional regulator [archaeon]|nr:DeoR family transcriptional regulator [archaeon]